MIFARWNGWWGRASALLAPHSDWEHNAGTLVSVGREDLPGLLDVYPGHPLLYVTRIRNVSDS